MNQKSEIYIFSLLHLLPHLKEEVRSHQPNWRYLEGHHSVSFYQADGDIDLKELHECRPALALLQGKVLGKGSKAEIEERVEAWKHEHNAVTIHYWDTIDESGKMGDRKIKGPVLDIFHIEKDLYFAGLRIQIRGDFAPFKGSSPLPKEKKAPTIAYYKVGEAFKHFRPLISRDEVFLDIGCAPGGSTYYLLKKGLRVIGVDSLEMDPIIATDFPDKFLMLNRDYKDLKPKHFKGLPPIHWLVFDVDDNGIEALESLLPLMENLKECMGIFMNVRVTKDFQIKDLDQMRKMGNEHGFPISRASVLPSLDKEVCLFLKR